MRTVTLLTNRQQNLPLIVGLLFLIGFWWVGFDGITFSDDVYYILAGKSFWEGTMEVNSYHFSSRWGAYIPAGLLRYFFGLDPHIISGYSLLSYLITLFILYKVLPDKTWTWLLTIWFCTQVYFMHFITKVYPDSSLVLWVTIIPVAAIYRKQQPVLAGLILVLALFVGFLTKETIIFLAPFVILLFLFDLKNKFLPSSFYISLVASGLVLASLYLTYFWIQFGDPFYRITSINAGHYISEYTYADKGIGAIVERLTITPIITFVERAYWPWLIFAIPGIYQGLKFRISVELEFALAFLCLLLGFWLMSSTLEFYNPIYLNPRHLIILIPILACLITLGWNSWQNSKKWKITLISLIGLGIIISAIQEDAKQVLFLVALIPVIWIKKRSFQFALLGIVLALPALFSIYYQKQLKQYQNLTNTLNELTQGADEERIIITNNFIYFSREILLPENKVSQERLFPIESLQELNKKLPKEIEVLIYGYYKHAYPKEQADVDLLESWLKIKNYQLESEEEIGNLWIRKFQFNTP
ncbi:hypothetical protein JYB62_03820 [Algoriphagus lutimaris]|uniref:hypothetical protein n=1 Tax=Algoriphagus lutimaris TaxID=613197 RepID=UPI00196B9B34|nr:hypothetical protein [Algoriphagus lutimaris]MBN3519120.1 hypothetical protein [Algoriphagus lutimaris]